MRHQIGGSLPASPAGDGAALQPQPEELSS